MNAIAVNRQTPDGAPPPWYRQGWPWFLISIPATSVLLGIMMITLAVRSNDALVVDDWYKEGKGINRRIERDGEATRLGVTARIADGAGGLVLDLGAEAVDFSPPPALDVRWVHVTRAELDGGARFVAAGGGRYVADAAALPETGRWRIHVEPVVDGTGAVRADVASVGVVGADVVAADVASATIAGAAGADDTSPDAAGAGSAWRLVSDVTTLDADSAPRLAAAPPGADRR